MDFQQLKNNLKKDFSSFEKIKVAILGDNATILPNVIIGKGSIVAAGAVVTKNVEPFNIVGGVPARRIGNIQHLK